MPFQIFVICIRTMLDFWNNSIERMRKMKLSRNFVSDYVDIDVDSKTLAEGMTSIGNEYDSCGPLLPVSNLIIGEVVDCVDHPNSDHLHVCQVNIGKEVLQIVCGAPNVRKG